MDSPRGQQLTKANLGSGNHKTAHDATIEITRWAGLTKPDGQRFRVRVVDFFARLAQKATQPSAQRVEKQALPGWSPAVFDNDKRARAGVQRVTALCLDYDNGDPLDQIGACWADFAGLLHTTPSHTPSAPRCRVIVLLSRAVTPDEHGRIYRWAMTKASAAGHKLDTAARDPSRLWFVPACQPGATGAAQYLGGQPIDVDQTLAAARSVEPVKPKAPKKAAQAGQPADAIDRAVAEIVASYGKTETTPGTRNSTLTREAFMIRQRADQGAFDWHFAAAQLEAAAIGNGMNPAEARDIIARAGQAAANSPREYRPTKRQAAHPALDPDDPGAQEPPPEFDGQTAPDLAPFADDAGPDWHKLLMFTQKGAIRATGGNCLTVFEQDQDLRVLGFDAFRDELTILRRPPWAATNDTAKNYPRTVSDLDLTRAGQFLERSHGVSFRPNTIADSIEAAAKQNTFDPLRVYLDGLAWDQEPRIGSWLSEFFGVERNVYTKEVGRRWLISAVARAFCTDSAGVQADHVLVFEGPQGARKSSGLRALAGEFFTDEVPDLASKDAAMSLSGVWVVELSELESLRRADLTKIKAWITRRVDRYRPPYGRATIARARRCVFAATTNDQHYLRDSTGNRRFWPIRCGAVDVAGLQAVRDQLWAEAVEAYRSGASWWLDSQDLQIEAQQAQAARTDSDPWEEPITEYIDGRYWVTTGEILEHLQVERGRADKLHARRISEILRKEGFTQRERVRNGQGGREYRFSKPESEKK